MWPYFMKKWVFLFGACVSACSGEIQNTGSGTTDGVGTPGVGNGSGGTQSTPSSGGGGIANGNGGASASGGNQATGGGVGTGGAGGSGASSGTTGRGGAGGGAGNPGSGGASGTAGSGGATNGGTGAGTLPRLTVTGNKLTDPTGKTIVLRGSSLIDVGSLYAYSGQSSAGITARMDKVAAAAVQGHVVRIPVYPKITYNGTRPTCSPVPYPVGTGPSAACTPKNPLSAADYVAQVLKPAVDYATSKSLYVIIDYHQIDDAATGASAADANTFWTDIAPKFANYNNVFYEPFNEPIDAMASWAALKPAVQGLVDTIRAAAPNNIIIVPSNSWDQRPGDAASDPPRGTNLMYTAHIYPPNWSAAFQAQVATAVAKAPVFITEWGYNPTDPNPHAWGTALQSTIDGNGASWTAWVTDNAWTPSMFSDMSLTGLTDFGTLVNAWLAGKANADWVR
jgi:endoglucanase